MLDKEYEKEGEPESMEIGILKNMKSSTHFLDGPIFLDLRMADFASATLPKTPPALVALNRAQWSM